MSKIRVKICCISNIEEAKMAVHYGASALGLVGKMPSGLGVINDKLIHDIAKIVQVIHVQPFGVDLCSSVRTNGKLDEKKLEDFFKPFWDNYNQPKLQPNTILQ